MSRRPAPQEKPLFLRQLRQQFPQVFRRIENVSVPLFRLDQQPQFVKAQQIVAGGLVDHIVRALVGVDAVFGAVVAQGMVEQGGLPVVEAATQADGGREQLFGFFLLTTLAVQVFVQRRDGLADG